VADSDKHAKYFFTAGINDKNKRIDLFLASNLSLQSRTFIQKIIEGKYVTVNGLTVHKNYKLSADDKISVSYDDGHFLPAEKGLLPQEIPLKIRYEDDYLLIISKDAGITVHPAAGIYTNTLVNALLFYLGKTVSDFDAGSRPGIVHRLDKYTSGLMIIAKNGDVQHKISELFKKREVYKVYKTLVLGNFSESKGKIKLPVGRSKTDRKKMDIIPDTGREAETEFEVIEKLKYATLLKAMPKTGRTHQIRVHFNSIGHPVIGDRDYGNIQTRKIADSIGLERQFLHSCAISFIHPVLKKKIEITDNLADDLLKSLSNLKKMIYNKEYKE